MEQRKYIKYKINELEDAYKKGSHDIAVLEDLKEELHHRSTLRARKLLTAVQKSVGGNDHSVQVSREAVSADPTASVKTSKNTNKPEVTTATPKPTIAIVPLHAPAPGQDAAKVIDWDEALTNAEFSPSNSESAKDPKPLLNNPSDILDVWTVLEALSPQSYKKPNDLIIGQGSVAYLQEAREPWLKGEKSRPKTDLYYMLYLGAIDIEKATEKLLSIYQDKRVERPSVRGLAALGVVLLDKKGVPIPNTGLALSSFGWSYARALQGKLQELKSWEIAEKKLVEGMDKYIYRADENDQQLPFTLSQARFVYQWLLKNCEIPAADSLEPSFVIRLYQPYSRGKPEAPLLNSFYLDDLQKAKQTVRTQSTGDALSQYLGITKPKNRFDILKDKQYLEIALQPKYSPAARWPSNGRHSLVLLQQAAVNLAKLQLSSGGLFSVNGPPGTGKTTLLRDIVASVLVDRAKALCAFKSVDDAFEHSGQMKLGNAFVHLYKLDDTLRGHEIFVASTNNKAVENVSKELPLFREIAQDIKEFKYFKTVSDALSDGTEETWGLCAAVLGNAKNRSEFINRAWWDDDTGLRKYFLSITGQLNLEVDNDGNEIFPRVIKECNPPRSMDEAKRRWDFARKEFEETLIKAQGVIDQAQKAYESSVKAAKLKVEIKSLCTNEARQKIEINNAKERYASLEKISEQKKLNVDQLKTQESDQEATKLGFFKRLFFRSEWKEWKIQHSALRIELSRAYKEYKLAQTKTDECSSELSTFHHAISHTQEKKRTLHSQRLTLLAEIEKYSPICGNKLVTSELWALEHDQQQIFSPNFTIETQRLRDDVFVAAFRVHKAFIDASSKQLRQNLGAFFSVLSGKGLPEDKRALLPHLWSSAFLLTPVMSTTFASVSRMLKQMPKESIGWLLIDEAGQAPPQAAIGAIYRSKRVICVGDPLQIEPVVTLPSPLLEAISKHFGVDPFHWIAPDGSVQTLSDNANVYGTTIPRELSEIRIGSPLLVHRRCEDPMFAISNRLAYNGLMVQATVPRESDITSLFGKQSEWFDIKGNAQEKWCPEEGEVVAEMLLKRIAETNGDPEIYVISPFKMVAERMSQRMRMEEYTLIQHGIENPNDWIYNNIGTIHTFQGKETKAVILLLGAPDPAQTGARNWATSNVNLLNVAVSRAKQNFYVVGNKSLWGDLENMKLVARLIGK